MRSPDDADSPSSGNETNYPQGQTMLNWGRLLWRHICQASRATAITDRLVGTRQCQTKMVASSARDGIPAAPTPHQRPVPKARGVAQRDGGAEKRLHPKLHPNMRRLSVKPGNTSQWKRGPPIALGALRFTSQTRHICRTPPNRKKRFHFFSNLLPPGASRVKPRNHPGGRRPAPGWLQRFTREAPNGNRKKQF